VCALSPFEPETEVDPASTGEVIVGVALSPDAFAETVTTLLKALGASPTAVARAFTSSPVWRIGTVAVQAPPATVAVATLAPCTQTSIPVPSASELVPETWVSPERSGLVTDGIDVAPSIGTASDGGLVPLPGAVAVAVTVPPAGSAGTVAVQVPPLVTTVVTG